MPAVPFDHLPADARLWVFPAARPLSEREQHLLMDHVDGFLARWAAHGAPVVGADERATGVSGCSIDSLYRSLGQLEGEMGVPLRDASLVFFRDEGGAVRAEPRPAFRQRARAGAVGPDTVVFDHTVTSVGDVRGGRWETELARAWHARAFPVGANG